LHTNTCKPSSQAYHYSRVDQSMNIAVVNRWIDTHGNKGGIAMF